VHFVIRLAPAELPCLVLDVAVERLDGQVDQLRHGAIVAMSSRREPGLYETITTAKGGDMKDGFTTCLWFDGQAEEAAEYYTSIFPKSKIGEIGRYTEAGPGEPGSVVAVEFEINGQKFVGLNGGPEFKFNEAISFQIFCKDQDEVDHYWNTLTEEGEESVCGWLKDKYGVSWQVIPDGLLELISDPDPEKAKRATEAMLSMRKLDIEAIRRAHAGEPQQVGTGK
jgi:predicted 3-demethylubiquinone-9 3-methyltransferase (glyoxalase superfamily)